MYNKEIIYELITKKKRKKERTKNKESTGAITSVDPVDGAMSLITATKQGI